MNKKGVEISMNVIIIAVLGLVVAVLILALVTGRLNIFSQGIGDCTVQGGKCAEACGDSDLGTENYPTPNPTVTCKLPDGEKGVCCLKVATTQ